MSKLDELQRLHAEATPAPWSAESRERMVTSVVLDKLPKSDWGMSIRIPCPPFGLGATGAAVCTVDPKGKYNAELIAAARNALPALLRVVDAAKPFAQLGDPAEYVNRPRRLDVPFQWFVKLADAMAELGGK